MGDAQLEVIQAKEAFGEEVLTRLLPFMGHNQFPHRDIPNLKKTTRALLPFLLSGVIAGYSATGFWEPSIKYVDRVGPQLGIEDETALIVLGYLCGASGVCTNTLQAWDIILELYERAVSGRSRGEKFLHGDGSAWSRFCYVRSLFLNVVLSLCSILPIYYITSKNETSIEAAVVAAFNFPVNYEGISKFMFRFRRRYAGHPKHTLLLYQAQKILSDVLMHSFDEFIQKDWVEIRAGLEALESARSCREVMTLLFQLSGNKDNDKVPVYRRSVPQTNSRFIGTLVATIVAVAAQGGYMTDSWIVGELWLESTIVLGLFLLVVTVLVYAGLTGESTQELCGRVGSGRTSTPQRLNGRLRNGFVYLIAFIGIFSGMTLAQTNYENFGDSDTALILFPAWAALMMEIFGAMSDSSTNVYYAFNLIDHCIRSYFMRYSSDETRRKLATLECNVSELSELFRAMRSVHFQAVLMGGDLERSVVEAILCQNGMKEADVMSLYNPDGHTAGLFTAIAPDRVDVPVMNPLSTGAVVSH